MGRDQLGIISPSVEEVDERYPSCRRLIASQQPLSRVAAQQGCPTLALQLRPHISTLLRSRARLAVLDLRRSLSRAVSGPQRRREAVHQPEGVALRLATTKLIFLPSSDQKEANSQGLWGKFRRKIVLLVVSFCHPSSFRLLGGAPDVFEDNEVGEPAGGCA